MFATAALLLSATSWWMLGRAVDAGIHQDLQERIDDVREQLHQFGPQLDPRQAQQRLDAIYKYRDDGKWLQILGDDGRWLYRSARMASGSAPLPPPGHLPAGGSIAELQQGARHIRTFSSAITVDGRTYSVETGISMNKPEALIRRFGLGLLLLTPGVLLAALLGGHLMGRKALAPVMVLASEARRINDRNLDARLPVYETQDEIAHLSVTLNNMLSRIDAGFRSVREFTANASHELRTPLARLRAEIEIALLSPRSAAEYRNTLEHMQEVAVDMTTLLESLLTLARAEAGQGVLHMVPVDVGALIESAIEEWAPVANRLSIRLYRERAASDREALWVLGDRLALLRLLRILLDNACKFTPPAGRVAISAAAKGDRVVLSVEDSGIGIAESHQGRVFERFYRVAGDTGRQRPGAGLGLSLAWWIAEQHGSSVTLASAPGAGSSFQIALARIETRIDARADTDPCDDAAPLPHGEEVGVSARALA
jgi:signal transduction histidine kinase